MKYDARALMLAIHAIHALEKAALAVGMIEALEEVYG